MIKKEYKLIPTEELYTDSEVFQTKKTSDILALRKWIPIFLCFVLTAQTGGGPCDSVTGECAWNSFEPPTALTAQNHKNNEYMID